MNSETKTTPERRAELLRLHEAATRGPWEAYPTQDQIDEFNEAAEFDGLDWTDTTEGHEPGIGMASYIEDPGCYKTAHRIEAAGLCPDDMEWDEFIANLQLIAAARNALPGLLADLDARDAEIALLRSRHTEMQEACNRDVELRRKAEAERNAALTASRHNADMYEQRAVAHREAEAEVRRLREALKKIHSESVPSGSDYGNSIVARLASEALATPAPQPAKSPWREYAASQDGREEYAIAEREADLAAREATR